MITMNPEERKKRGRYKGYLNPGASFILPRRTAKRYKQEFEDAQNVPSDDSGEYASMSEDEVAQGPSDISLVLLEDVRPKHRDIASPGSLPDNALHVADDEAAVPESGDTIPLLDTTVASPSTLEEARVGSEHFGLTGTAAKNSTKSGLADGLADFFSELVSQKVTLSRGDILMMVLKYSLHMNLSFTGLTGLIKMINSFFEYPILPDTKHGINKVFEKSGTSMAFHFFCPQCLIYLGSCAPGSLLHCSQCGQPCGSSAMADAPFFVLLDLPSQLRKVLKECEFRDLTEPLQSTDTLSDMLDGSMYREFVAATEGWPQNQLHTKCRRQPCLQVKWYINLAHSAYY